MRTVVGLTVLAALVAAGCKGAGDSAANDPARAALVKVVDTVKASVPTAKAGDITWYEAENLYEYIDGDAGRFTDAGFVWVAHTEWRSADAQDKAYVEMAIYDLSTPQGAMDILGDSRTEKTQYLPLGNEAIDDEDLMELRVGRYYVKLTPRRDPAATKPQTPADMKPQTPADMKPLMKALAEALVKAAPAGPTDEALAVPLPAERMVPHTVSYVTKGFLGREFLQHVREATYESGGKRVRLFVMDAGSDDKARAAFAEWKESVPPQPARPPDMPNTFTSTEEYVGTIILAHKDRWVAGAIGDETAARLTLDAFLRHLE